MGCGLGKLRVSSRTPNRKKSIGFEVVLLSKSEVDFILGDPAQTKGIFLLYQDVNTKKFYLAFKCKSGKTEHYVITPRNDLYYINGFPFPYMEAIVFYYQKHRFNGTLLTQQAFIEPYLLAHKRSSRSPTPTKAQTFNRKDRRRQNRRRNDGNYKKFLTL